MAALCKTGVMKVYNQVIEDVISNVREQFIDDGVDEQVLQEMKQLWESKLMSSKAVENPETETKAQSQPAKAAPPAQTVNSIPAPAQTISMLDANKMVPIQITLPGQPGTDSPARVLTIQVPASALQGNQLHSVLTGPVISATMGLPQQLASSLLQQHVNAALMSQQVSIGSLVRSQVDGASDASDADVAGEVLAQRVRNDAALLAKLRRRQVDGAMDTSDEEEDGTDEEEDDEEPDEDKDDEDADLDDGGPEEEPLNSEDDVTDEEPTDLFDTDNVVVCQYDKITRTRNKWKFYFKDGIMNLNGEDFVFQKANGDAEW